MSPARDVRERALAYAERLRGHSPPVSAVGIGGSLGRGDADAHSDIDVFVFFDAGDVFEHAQWLMAKSTVGIAPLSVSTPKFFAGFGLCVSFVLSDSSKVEFFLNTPTSWSEDPMRANTEIVWDRSGRYTELVRQSRTPEAYGRAEVSARIRALHDLVLESLNLSKYAHRGDVWSMHYRVAIVRRILVAFLVSDLSKAEFGIQNAMARVAFLPPREVEDVRRSVPSVDSRSMAESLRALESLAGRVADVQGFADTRWHVVLNNLSRAAVVLDG